MIDLKSLYSDRQATNNIASVGRYLHMLRQTWPSGVTLISTVNTADSITYPRPTYSMTAMWRPYSPWKT